MNNRRTSRPKIEPTAREELLRLLADGMPRQIAAQHAGVPRDSVAWAHIMDSELEEAMRQAEAEAEGKVAQALFEAATSGNVAAAKLFLEGRQARRRR